MMGGVRLLSGPFESLGMDAFIVAGIVYMVVRGLNIIAANWLWNARLDGAIRGIVLGFLGRWWSDGWIRLSLGLLILVLVLMLSMATKYFHPVRKAAGLPYLEGSKEHAPLEPASPEALTAFLKEGRPHTLTLLASEAGRSSCGR